MTRGYRVKSVADLPAHVRPVGIEAGKARPRKYRNIPTVVDGRRFDSKLEARCYEELKLRAAAGDVLWFIPQVNFPLEGGVKYRCDFLACLASGGVEILDAKGMLTQSSRNKIKQVQERYGITVRLWTGRA